MQWRHLSTEPAPPTFASAVWPGCRAGLRWTAAPSQQRGYQDDEPGVSVTARCGGVANGLVYIAQSIFLTRLACRLLRKVVKVSRTLVAMDAHNTPASLEGQRFLAKYGTDSQANPVSFYCVVMLPIRTPSPLSSPVTFQEIVGLLG